MTVKDENQAFESIQEVIAFLNEQLTDARYKIQIHSNVVNRLSESVKSMDHRLTQLKILAAGWPKNTPIPEPVATSTPDESLKNVVAILSANSGPMRIKSIAKYAFDKGLIRSTGGIDGVTSIVSNIMSRHSPRLFVNTGWGWWDVAERHKPKATEDTQLRIVR
jgi:hypothetical protein